MTRILSPDQKPLLNSIGFKLKGKRFESVLNLLYWKRGIGSTVARFRDKEDARQARSGASKAKKQWTTMGVGTQHRNSVASPGALSL